MRNQGKHFNSKKYNKPKNTTKRNNVKSNKKKGFKNKISTLLIIFFLIVIVISGKELVEWYMNNRENQNIINDLKSENIVTYDENDEISVDFAALKQINSEIVGYIEVNNTNISYPVVQSSDNDYYLTHNFKTDYNSAGWVFMDYRNNLDGTDKNIIIYGHNMRDGSMFGSLKNVLNSDWYQNEENYYITFLTENETLKYEVFSVYQIEKEDYYITTKFANDAEYEKFLNTIVNRSVNDFEVEVSSEDTILTLSTCANNNQYRVVLHAKKVE